jgi:hypothetical protein
MVAHLAWNIVAREAVHRIQQFAVELDGDRGRKVAVFWILISSNLLQRGQPPLVHKHKMLVVRFNDFGIPVSTTGHPV